MQPIRTLTVTFDADLGTRLAEAAERSGLSPVDLVLRAVRNELDGVTAYARVTDEVNLVKDGLAALAGLVGEVLAVPPPDLVGSICRYDPPASSPDP